MHTNTYHHHLSMKSTLHRHTNVLSLPVSYDETPSAHRPSIIITCQMSQDFLCTLTHIITLKLNREFICTLTHIITLKLSQDYTCTLTHIIITCQLRLHVHTNTCVKGTIHTSKNSGLTSGSAKDIAFTPGHLVTEASISLHVINLLEHRTGFGSTAD